MKRQKKCYLYTRVSTAMQDYGVKLICVEDGIDSSKDADRLMISVLSAVAEIERENIRTLTTGTTRRANTSILDNRHKLVYLMFAVSNHICNRVSLGTHSKSACSINTYSNINISSLC